MAARYLSVVFTVCGIFLLDIMTATGAPDVLPSITPSRTPKGTPTPYTASFSMHTGNTSELPDVLDVVQELFLASISVILPSEVPEDNLPCKQVSSTAPYIASDSERKEELMREVSIVTCGWMDEEQLNVTLAYPNSKVVRNQIITKDGYTSYRFTPLWEDPTGIYHITFRGLSGTAIAEVNIFRPIMPRAIVFSKRKLFLYHFYPNENVRLVAYKNCEGPSVCLEAWQTYQVDAKGNLSLSLGADLDTYRLAVLGQRSGELRSTFLSRTRIGSYDLVRRGVAESWFLRSSCAGAPPQRIKVGWRGIISTISHPIIVRQEPSLSGREITRLHPGTKFTVTDGPRCANNWSWWKVQWETNESGWIPEGGDHVDPYFIRPFFN